MPHNYNDSINLPPYYEFDLSFHIFRGHMRAKYDGRVLMSLVGLHFLLLCCS